MNHFIELYTNDLGFFIAVTAGLIWVSADIALHVIREWRS